MIRSTSPCARIPHAPPKLLDLCRLRTSACLADDYDFLPEIADQIYNTTLAAIRRWDGPDAVVMGDTAVLDWVPDGVLKRAGKRFHGQSYQPGGGMIGPPTDDRLVALKRSELDRLHRLVGEKPILIADLGFAFTRPPYRFYEWGLYPDEAAAAAAYKSWAVGAAEIPYVLGFQKCQYIDRVEEQPLLGIKMGLLNFVSRLHFYCSTSLFLI